MTQFNERFGFNTSRHSIDYEFADLPNVPTPTPEQEAAALLVVLKQPDGGLLADMLGLAK